MTRITGTFAAGVAALFLAWFVDDANAAANPYWAELVLQSEEPYVEQTVLAALRIYSDTPLQRVEIDFPSTPGLVIRAMEGPLSRPGPRGSRRVVVTEYRYAVTPLVPGAREVGPVEVRVTPTASGPGGGGQTYGPWGRPQGQSQPRPVNVSTKAVELEVRPPEPDVRPWFPVHQLDMQASWSGLDGARVGEPLDLQVTLVGRGVTGAQLPDVSKGLGGEDFKLYPGESHVEWTISEDGSTLWGRRIEQFTVVPVREGERWFKGVDVTWWDVGRDAKSVTLLAPQRVQVAHAVGGESRATSVQPPGRLATLLAGDTFRQFILPVGGGLAVAYALGWWVGSSGRRRRGRAGTEAATAPEMAPGEAPADGTAAASAPAGSEHQDEAARERRPGPREVLAAGMRGLVLSLPLRTRLWWCVRCINAQDDAPGLCRILRRFACEQLKMPPNASLPAIADRLSPAGHPGGIRDLFRQLDDAAYAGRFLDLPDWKRRFRPLFVDALGRRRTGPGTAVQGLPPLNP